MIRKYQFQDREFETGYDGGKETGTVRLENHFEGQAFEVEYDAKRETVTIRLGNLKGYIKATNAGDPHPYQYTVPRKKLSPEEFKRIMTGTPNRADSIAEAADAVCRQLLAERRHLDNEAQRAAEHDDNRDRLREWAESLPPAADDAE